MIESLMRIVLPALFTAALAPAQQVKPIANWASLNQLVPA
jgi:hypothetical protein